MSYRIVLTKSAIKELGGLPLKAHDQVVGHLRQLEENPDSLAPKNSLQ